MQSGVTVGTRHTEEAIRFWRIECRAECAVEGAVPRASGESAAFKGVLMS
jgi:hypothetical protein